MKWQHSDRSKKDYDDLDQKIQKAFDKQTRILADNLLHPSLRAKKFNETEDIWQARISVVPGSICPTWHTGRGHECLIDFVHSPGQYVA